MNRRIVFLICTAFFSASIIACGQSLSIKMNESVPPTFTFDGSRFAHYSRLNFFIVTEVAPENQKLPAYSNRPVENKIIWQIWPKDSENGEYGNLPSITYGKVPQGWTQKIPESDLPPQLVEGKVYEVGGPQISVPEAFMRFTICNGKAVRLPFYEWEFEQQNRQND